MAVTFLDKAKEENRQELADDKKFWKSFIYFFELVVPDETLEGTVHGGHGGVTSMLFPLVLNPQGISVSEPFALTATPTVAGGLFLEENGVLARTIVIEGHTGFKPRPVLGTGVALSEFFKTDALSFERRGKRTPLAVSGQRHFQFLQDRVFRTYAELKRDPSTSRLTKLAFHNPKDDESWEVAPIRFEMRRDVSSRFIYRYSIELLAYNVAKKREDEFVTEDKSWLDKIKDTIQDIKDTIDSIIAFVQEVQQFIRELEQLVTGVLSLVSKITDFINAVSDFIGGVADFIATPFKAVADIVNGLDAAIERMAALPDQFRDTIKNAFRRCADAFDNFGTHKDVFASPAQQKIAKLNALREIGTSKSASTLDDAESNPPKTLRAVGKLGTKPMPGDRLRADASRSPAARTPVFTSAVEHVVGATDSLQSLAATFLGDARQWRAIAALNDLSPPYISESPLPRTVRPGSRILIPSRARAPLASPNAAILGAPREVSLAEQILGVDLLLAPISGTRDQYDFVLDPASNGTDIKLVKGVANLEQAMRTRMITEQGSNVLYRRLGRKRLVGIGIPAVDDEVVRLRLREAIAADPRIADVGTVRFNESASPDAVDVEIDATVRGLNQPITVAAPVTT